MDLIYSEEWKKKDQDRKDFTYSPLSKNLTEAMYFPYKDSELAIKILDNYIDVLEQEIKTENSRRDTRFTH